MAVDKARITEVLHPKSKAAMLIPASCTPPAATTAADQAKRDPVNNLEIIVGSTNDTKWKQQN